jgi:hypothetical protein
MRRMFFLRYAFVTALIVAFLGIAGSPIIYSDRANAAEEKQKSIKAKKSLKYKWKKHFRLKPIKKRPPGRRPLRPWWCMNLEDDCD